MAVIVGSTSSLSAGRDSAGEKADAVRGARCKTSPRLGCPRFVGSVGVGSGTVRDWRPSRSDERLVSSGSHPETRDDKSNWFA